VACAWRSFLTTLEWPLKDAIIRAVAPLLSCERRCGRRDGLLLYMETSHTLRILKSCVVAKQLLGYFDWRISVLCTKTEHTSFQCSCAAVLKVDQNNVSWVMIAVCANTYSYYCTSSMGYCAWLLLCALNILSCCKLHTIDSSSSASGKWKKLQRCVK